MLLKRRSANKDASYFSETQSYLINLLINEKVSEAEVKRCLIESPITIPGIDRISVNILGACWNHIEHVIFLLYQQWLELGHHPKIFRKVEIIMLPKPSKRDLCSAMFWRPIALFSSIAKGVKRLIAKSLRWAAINQMILSSPKLGELPKRFSTDLVSYSVRNIEKVSSEGMSASLLTPHILGCDWHHTTRSTTTKSSRTKMARLSHKMCPILYK